MRGNNNIQLNIEELFPVEWYETVTRAANYVLSNIDVPEENLDDIVTRIIEYNIHKQINDKLLELLTEDLPTYLCLIDTPVTKVFNEFKNILDACDVCPKFKRHSLYIQSNDIVKDKKTVDFWKKLAKKDYPNLTITTRALKCPECIKLNISKK